MRDVREQNNHVPDGKALAAAAALSSPLLLTALVGFRLFSMHGSMGLYGASPGVRAAWRGIVLLALLLPLASLLMLHRVYAGRVAGERRRSVLVVAAWVLTAGAVLLPTSVYGEITSWGERRSGDKPPLLLITESVGVNGIPDLALTFWTEEESSNRVEWSRLGCPYRTEEEEEPSRSHVFLLRDLEPRGEYYYRLNGGDPVFFRAPPAGGVGGLRFALASDAHFGLRGADREAVRDVLRSVVGGEGRADMLFLAGDLVDLGYEDSHWQEALDALGEEAACLPLAVLPGNHDTMLGGVRLFVEYLLPWKACGKGTPELWWRVDVGDIHLFLMDLEWGADVLPDEQRDWLEAELAAVPPDDWTVVISHACFFASGSRFRGVDRYDDEGMIDTFAPVFRRWGVDLVVSGHNHHLELLEDGGVTYAVVGAMGGKAAYPLDRTSPASIWREAEARGYLLVEARGDALRLEFRESGGGILGAFMLERGKGPQPLEASALSP